MANRIKRGAHLKSCAVVWSLGILLASCSNTPAPATGAAVQCPEGQSYDGQFCQVDQRVGTVEQPSGPAPSAAAESKPSADATAATPAQEPVAGTPAEAQGSLPAQTGLITPLPEVLPEPETPVETVERSPAAPVDYAMAAQAAPVIQYLAGAHLPAGARPLGSPFAGQFAEGQALVKKVQVSKGKCYTIVGIGLPPVTELNIEIQDPEDQRVLLSDETSGNQAVVGSRNDCYTALESGDLTLVLIVQKGRGVAAAQVFQK